MTASPDTVRDPGARSSAAFQPLETARTLALIALVPGSLALVVALGLFGYGIATDSSDPESGGWLILFGLLGAVLGLALSLPHLITLATVRRWRRGERSHFTAPVVIGAASVLVLVPGGAGDLLGSLSFDAVIWVVVLATAATGVVEAVLLGRFARSHLRE